jgi:hypothetical protein
MFLKLKKEIQRYPQATILDKDPFACKIYFFHIKYLPNKSNFLYSYKRNFRFFFKEENEIDKELTLYDY